MRTSSREIYIFKTDVTYTVLHAVLVAWIRAIHYCPTCVTYVHAVHRAARDVAVPVHGQRVAAQCGYAVANDKRVIVRRILDISATESSLRIARSERAFADSRRILGTCIAICTKRKLWRIGWDCPSNRASTARHGHAHSLYVAVKFAGAHVDFA